MARIKLLDLVVYVIFCFGIISTTTHAEESSTDNNVMCGKLYNQPNGIVRYSNGSSSTVPIDKTCTWFIEFDNTNSTETEVFLVIEEFRLSSDDKLTIYKNDSAKAEQLKIKPFSGQLGPFSVLTGVKHINVELVTSKTPTEFNRKFQMHYYTTAGCQHTLTSVKTGTLESPTYEANRINTINCTFSLTQFEKDGFILATTVTSLPPVLDNINLTVTGSDLDRTYHGIDLPWEFTSSKNLKLQMVIKPNGKSLQQLQIAYELVTKECSGTFKLEKGHYIKFENPTSTEASVSDTPSLNCRKIVFTEDITVVALTVRVDAHTLPGSLDQLQVLNGIDSQATSLLQLTSSSEKDWEDQYIMTNRKNLSISLLSNFPSPKMNVSITISTADNGGYFENSGNITVSNQGGDPAIFLLKVDPKKQVKLDLGKTTFKEGKLKLFYNFEEYNNTPFAQVDKTSNATSVISPSHMMMVQATDFKTEVFLVPFDSVERGCFSSSTEEIGSYNLFGKCVKICAWTIAPKPNATNDDFRKLHFSSLLLNPDDRLLVMYLDKTVLVNVTGPLHNMPDFQLPANEGVNIIITRNCSRNETTLVADYAPLTKCERNFTLETGKSMIISTPGYPSSYPIKSECVWRVRVNSTALIHVSFKSLQLGGTDHKLGLKTSTPTEEKLLVQFVGPTCSNATLPQDYIISGGNLTIDFEGGAFNSSIANSIYGFQLTVTAAGCGGEIMKQSGSFNTAGKGNTTDDKLCFWLLGVDNKTENIVQYNVSSSSSPKGYLKIHEGASIRDQLSPDVNGTNLLSRLDRILFVYRNPNSTAGPAVNVTFKALACTTNCDNGVCMHSVWMCNGVNDCGDWSDERNCNSTGPCPTPQPSPPQPPSPGGVSGGSLAGGILGALLIGALLGFLAPIFLQWYRSRPSTEYSTLMGASG